MTSSPKIGGVTGATFPLQFPRAKVDLLSLAVVLIEHLSNDGTETTLFHSTGFMWRNLEDIWLITARHVLSGLDPFDDQILSAEGYIPQRIRIHPTYHAKAGYKRYRPIVDLQGDSGQPLWKQDPEFSELRTDIAAIKIVDAQSSTVCVNDVSDFGTPIQDDLFTHIGADCSIVGYPNSNVNGVMVPIWRRASFSSEPLFPVYNKPIFLLDALTSQGFSGSPVFRRHYGPAPYHGDNDGLIVKAESVVVTQLIGFYAGRLMHSYYGGEIPFAFYANRIGYLINSI